MNRTATLLVFSILVAGIARSAEPVPSRTRFGEPVSFHSAGQLVYATGAKQRDRTITMTPVDRDGIVATLDTSIIDHIDDEFEYRGVLNVDEGGAVTTRSKDMVNAANILAVSPQTMRQLREGRSEVVTQGHLEVNGDVLDVHCTHRLVGEANALPLRVKTSTSTPDGKIALETEAAFGADSLPLSARTTGSIKTIVTVTVDLTLTRLARDAARASVPTEGPQAPVGGR